MAKDPFDTPGRRAAGNAPSDGTDIDSPSDIAAARAAIDVLRPMCDSPASQAALKVVEADVVGNDNSSGPKASNPMDRMTPGRAAAGSAPVPL